MRKELPYYDLSIVTEVINGVKQGLKTKTIAEVLNAKGYTTITGLPFTKNYLELQFHLSRFPAKTRKPKFFLSMMALIKDGMLSLQDAALITQYKKRGQL